MTRHCKLRCIVLCTFGAYYSYHACLQMYKNILVFWGEMYLEDAHLGNGSDPDILQEKNAFFSLLQIPALIT